MAIRYDIGGFRQVVPMLVGIAEKDPKRCLHWMNRRHSSNQLTAREKRLFQSGATTTNIRCHGMDGHTYHTLTRAPNNVMIQMVGVLQLVVGLKR